MGTFASKVLVFLLMPLYTAILSAEEFGVADLVAQTANLLIPLAAVGICDGLFRFALDTAEGDRKKVFTASMCVLALGSAVLVLVAGVLCTLGGAIASYLPLITAYVVCANFHSALAHYLRAKGRTTLFAVQGIINTALTITLNILFLVVWRMGSTGYVLSVIVADFPVQLSIANINGENFAGSLLQKAIGKTAGGCTGIAANIALRFYTEKGQRLLKLQTATAHIGTELSTNFNLGILLHSGTGLIYPLSCHKHKALHNNCLSLGAALSQPTI